MEHDGTDDAPIVRYFPTHIFWKLNYSIWSSQIHIADFNPPAETCLVVIISFRTPIGREETAER
jgi:hypothetical protein